MSPRTGPMVALAALAAACSDDRTGRVIDVASDSAVEVVDAVDAVDADDVVIAAGGRAACEPCRADPVCGAGAYCLDYLGLGAFCGAACDAERPCADGFSCVEVDTLAGVGVMACVHPSGMCPCTPEVAARAEPTLCLVSNDFGSCRGERTCDGAAWGACDAPAAAPEIGNGKDDDCDGATDESACACGDGVCDASCGEVLATCPCDCAVSGDGVCSPCGESPLTAPIDCCRSQDGGAACGDGVCMGFGCGETPGTCPDDCGSGCGNDVCEPGENPWSCLTDCGHKVCGNRVCESTDGGPEACPQDCSAFCGDCVCDPLRDESIFNCPIDCGACGDRECSPCTLLGESVASCPDDCCEPGATCVVAGSCHIGRLDCGDDAACLPSAELWPPGVPCGPAACEGDALRLEARCAADGACEPGLLVPCGGYVCREAACLTACDPVSGGDDCAAGYTCQDGACEPLRPRGDACDDATQCADGFCEDGVCCDRACGATCTSCALAAARGTCTIVPGGADPDGDCEATPGDVCGLTGACDGAGACAFVAIGVPCDDAGCRDGVLFGAASCDGIGHCTGAGATPCPSGACRPDGQGCLTAKWPDGTPCAPGEDALCDSGACSDGYCCDTDCDGVVCKQCDLFGREGVCSPVLGGPDPDCLPALPCTDNCTAICDATGTCDDGIVTTTTCFDDGGCPASQWCGPSFTCVDDLPLGSPCPRPAACASELCNLTCQ